MDQWTRKEEAELQRLMKRKNEVTAKNMAPLVELVRNLLSYESGAERLAEALAESADSFRDALAPFDSGIRQEAVRAA